MAARVIAAAVTPPASIVWTDIIQRDDLDDARARRVPLFNPPSETDTEPSISMTLGSTDTPSTPATSLFSDIFDEIETPAWSESDGPEDGT